MSIDKWMFFSGLFFLILSFFIKKYKKTSIILRGVAILLIIVPLVLPKQFFGKWDAIKKLKNKDVISIILQPSQPEWDVNLSDSIINISDKGQIDYIISLLKKTDIYIPNHPDRIWETKITLVTEGKDSLALRIDKTQNNGTVIYEAENRFRKDELAEYLEKITNYTVPKFSLEFKKR